MLRSASRPGCSPSGERDRECRSLPQSMHHHSIIPGPQAWGKIKVSHETGTRPPPPGIQQGTLSELRSLACRLEASVADYCACGAIALGQCVRCTALRCRNHGSRTRRSTSMTSCTTSEAMDTPGAAQERPQVHRTTTLRHSSLATATTLSFLCSACRRDDGTAQAAAIRLVSHDQDPGLAFLEKLAFRETLWDPDTGGRCADEDLASRVSHAMMSRGVPTEEVTLGRRRRRRVPLGVVRQGSEAGLGRPNQTESLPCGSSTMDAYWMTPPTIGEIVQKGPSQEPNVP